MNPDKCDGLGYIHFLIASVDVFTCTVPKLHGVSHRRYDVGQTICQKHEPGLSSMKGKTASVSEWDQYLYVAVDRWKRHNSR